MRDDTAKVLAAIAELDSKVSALAAQAHSPTSANPRSARQSYSTAEAARLIGRAEYTVRQYCNEGRIIAIKRFQRRGRSALWSIPAEEIQRFQDEGLLPPNPHRNHAD